MAKFLTLGKYSLEALRGMSAVRTKQASALIEKEGGKVDFIYVLLGSYDLALLVELPDIAAIMRASVNLTRLTNVVFTTFPAVTVEDFDKMTGLGAQTPKV